MDIQVFSALITNDSRIDELTADGASRQGRRLKLGSARRCPHKAAFVDSRFGLRGAAVLDRVANPESTCVARPDQNYCASVAAVVVAFGANEASMLGHCSIGGRA